MSSPTAKLLVSVMDDVVRIRVCGRANFNSSVDFKALVARMREKGFGLFGLDLSECVVMDSTFLGVLAGVGLDLEEARHAGKSSCMTLFNPNDRVAGLVENLGISHLFELSREAGAGDDKQFKAVDSDSHSRLEVSKTCLKAHQTLMEINPDNVSKFKDVTEFLEEDLKKLQS